MKYEKLKDGGFVHNCHLIPRGDEKADYLFYQDGDKSITAFLNGYAIIPLEDYFKLTSGSDMYNSLLHNQPEQREEKLRQQEMLKNIEEADKQLHI